MKRFFIAFAALAMLLVVTESASARSWWGVSGGWGWGGPYVGASYGTRVGNSGFVSVGAAVPLGGYGGYGYSYPAYGYSSPVYYSTPAYSTPVYGDSTYVAPATYTTPVYTSPMYYSTPAYYSTPYYSSPSIGFSYWSGGRTWRGWR
ncbi:MAG: hypothetical protein J2P46_03485 [Zavarzinella sp.]|nr:hypothetical protein [Zavarzinella sp.]